MIGIRSLFRSRKSSVIYKRNMGWAAVCQMTSTNNLQANIDQAAGLVEKAATKGAEVIFLPEAFDFIAESGSQTLELAQPLTGTTIRSFRELAEKHKVWISLGGFHQKVNEEDKKIFNTHIIINSSGDLVETYCKAHLFDVDVPGKFRLKESDYVKPGASIAGPVQSPIGNIGLGICYDLRFPELSHCLREAGADILTFPSAFTVPTGLAHWKPLLQARAIETQCYVIAAAQVGKHNAKRSSYGHALVVDPWGTVIAEARDGISFALAEIDLDYLKNTRQNMPVNLQRRTDLFHPPSLPSSNITGLPEEGWLFNFGPAKVYGHSVLYKTDKSVVFVNKKPVVPGHLLICPLRSVKRMTELTTAEVTDLFCTVQKVEAFLMHKFSTDSCNIGIQDGPLAGQSIPHLHVHVLPRKEGDFKHNDDIYKELEQHDKVVEGWRTEEEMAAEAKLFREDWRAHFS